MNFREENIARSLIQGFIKGSIPDYIRDVGQSIIQNNGVQKLTIRKEHDIWYIDSIVQEEDFQNYSPQLIIFIEESRVSHTCNCHGAFRGVNILLQ